MPKCISVLLIAIYCMVVCIEPLEASQQKELERLVTEYSSAIDRNEKLTQNDLKEWIVKFEAATSNLGEDGDVFAFNQFMAELYYRANDYSKAENLYAKILADVGDQIEVHPNVELEAAYRAFRSSLFTELSADDSVVYLDIFEKAFDESVSNEDVVSSYAFKRVQTDRYRAKAYETQFSRTNGQAEDERIESLAKAVEWQKKYVASMDEGDDLYGNSGRLDHMGWGPEGSLLELGKYQGLLADLYQDQKRDDSQIRSDAVSTFEELLQRYPQKRYSDPTAAALLQQKALQLKSPKLFLDYSKTIVDKVGKGYEFIGALHESMMQIASYNQWPDGPKWENSGSIEAKEAAIEIGDFIRETTIRLFPDKYTDVNILKHALMMQTKYCIDTDNFIKAIETFNEVSGYGIVGKSFIKIFEKLEARLKKYIGGTGGNLEEILMPGNLGNAITNNAIQKKDNSDGVDVNKKVNASNEIDDSQATPRNISPTVENNDANNKTGNKLIYVISGIFALIIFGFILKRCKR